MTNPMTPPPLPPGYAPPPIAAMPAPAPYPAPAAAPAPAAMPAPQGYPGPAVVAPMPSPMPAPVPYAAGAYPAAPAPAPAYPAPAAYPPAAPPPHGYGAPAGYAAPAPAAYGQPPQQSQYVAPQNVADIGAAIAGATGGDRVPAGEPGAYTLEILETICTRHPVEGKLTFRATFKVLSSTNPSFPEGSEICYLEGLKYESSGKRVQDFLIAAQGFPARIAYDQAMLAAGHQPQQALSLIGSAAGNPATQIVGNPYPANPLKGRRVSAVITAQTKVAGPRSSKPQGTVSHFKGWSWSPSAA